MATYYQYKATSGYGLYGDGMPGGKLPLQDGRSVDIPAMLHAGGGTITVSAADQPLLDALDAYWPVRLTGTAGSGPAVEATVETRDLDEFGRVYTDGTGDNAAVFARAAGSGVPVIVLPMGLLASSAPVAGEGTQVLRGAGRSMTYVHPQGNFDGIQLVGDHSTVEHLTVRRSLAANAAAPSAGALIKSISGANHTVRSVRLSSGYNLFDAQDSYGWTLTDVDFLNVFNYGALVRDTVAIDRGDQNLYGCVFDNDSTTLTGSVSSGGGSFTTAGAGTAQAPRIRAGQVVMVGLSTAVEAVTVQSVNYGTGVVTLAGTFANNHANGEPVKRGAAAVRYESGGGLKIFGTKILNHRRAVDLAVVDGAVTSVFCLSGNSYENQNDVSLRFARATGGTTGQFSYISVSGGELSCQGDGIRVAAGVETVGIGGGLVMHGTGNATAIDLAGGNAINVAGVTFHQWTRGVAIANTVINPNVDEKSCSWRNCTYRTEDNRTHVTTSAGLVTREHSRFVSVTSAATYTNLFQLDMNLNGGAEVEVLCEGASAAVSAFARSSKFIVRRGGSGAAVASAESQALETTTASGGQTVDMQIDVATTSGSVLVGFRRNSAGGGTQVDMLVTVRIRGRGCRRVQEV